MQWPVERAAGVKAGNGLEGNRFGGVTVVGALVEDSRIQRRFLRPRIEAHAALNGGTEVSGMLLPFLLGGGEVLEREVEGGFALIGLEEVAFAKRGAVDGHRGQEWRLGLGVGRGVR